MNHRTTARVVGSLFIVATLAGLAAAVVEQPILAPPDDYLPWMSRNADRVITGAFLELIMATAVVAIPVAAYPVLRCFSERLALGYVIARAVEGMILLAATTGLLTMLTVGQQFAAANPADAPHIQTLGDVVMAARDWAGHTVLSTVAFPMAALILNTALYRARLVPRWLAGWGLLGAILYWSAGIGVLVEVVEPFRPSQIVLVLPLAVQEMALAAWLIAKGFDLDRRHPQTDPVSPR
ncbi:uncharacterized protein DUF4386 [Micromonospora sp. Llam0]|uniref:DUF4386 domain-containing protein n=1 Tax=Micromonospora sp. Llam0 TaxID=2485143 RepID=UPI000F4793DE|nr:DUF4386 domain-containing protein [Micromonospora sp. Llam0]ROO50740.1 uncharacterized protein DUF4386 [Micromonospora sp. Llam0]